LDAEIRKIDARRDAVIRRLVGKVKLLEEFLEGNEFPRADRKIIIGSIIPSRT
jgi:hypothetical protein